MKSERRKQKPATKPNKEPKLSRSRQPGDLSLEDWQRGLRRQFGREQAFGLENLGSEPFFSEFRVSNPRRNPAIAWRFAACGPGDNFCSCPDFATNELGTCKHIEFTLARLAKKRGAKAAFARGYQPAFRELYLRNDGARARAFPRRHGLPAGAARSAAGSCSTPQRRAAAGRAPRRARTPFLAMASQARPRAARLRRCARLRRRQARCGAAGRDARRAVPAGRGRSQAAGKLLKVPLYPYQAEGALFAARAGRALIGDEMGLGKTIQAIAAAEILARHFGVSAC